MLKLSVKEYIETIKKEYEFLSDLEKKYPGSIKIDSCSFWLRNKLKKPKYYFYNSNLIPEKNLIDYYFGYNQLITYTTKNKVCFVTNFYKIKSSTVTLRNNKKISYIKKIKIDDFSENVLKKNMIDNICKHILQHETMDVEIITPNDELTNALKEKMNGYLLFK